MQAGVERTNMLVRIGELVALSPPTQTGIRHAVVEFGGFPEAGIFIATEASLTARTKTDAGSSVVVLTFGQSTYTKIIIGTIQIVT